MTRDVGGGEMMLHAWMMEALLRRGARGGGTSRAGGGVLSMHLDPIWDGT